MKSVKSNREKAKKSLTSWLMPVAPSVIWACFPFWRGGTKSGLCAGFRKGIIQVKLTSARKEGVAFCGGVTKNPVSCVNGNNWIGPNRKNNTLSARFKGNILTAARINIPPFRTSIRYGRHALYRLKRGGGKENKRGWMRDSIQSLAWEILFYVSMVGFINS